MQRIEKKIWPEFFDKVKEGIKTYELRLADFECQPGDLVLKEWDPKTKQYTGRQLEKTITDVVKTKDLNFWSQEDIDKYGYQIVGIK